VLGDLSWQVRSEPWEYSYATHLKAELPHKDDEAAMVAEVSAANSVVVWGKEYGSWMVLGFGCCIT
jgi:hypothetical protein